MPTPLSLLSQRIIKKRLLVLAFAFSALLTSMAIKSNPSNPKHPILVIPGELTLNGVNRPDLKRSFCDSITGKLLQSGMFIIKPIAKVIESSDREAATRK